MQVQVQVQEPGRAWQQEQAQAQAQERVPGLQEPKHRRSPWRPWQASKKRCASIDQKRFSRLRQKHCANC